MTNFGAAPVCSEPTTSPTQQGTSNSIPAIPPVQPNMASMLATIRALTQAVQQLANQMPSSFVGGHVNQEGFTEVSRKTQLVRVFQKNPDGTINKNNFVDVQRITSLNMKDKKSKSTWQFNGNYQDGDNIEVLE